MLFFSPVRSRGVESSICSPRLSSSLSARPGKPQGTATTTTGKGVKAASSAPRLGARAPLQKPSLLCYTPSLKLGESFFPKAHNELKGRRLLGRGGIQKREEEENFAKKNSLLLHTPRASSPKVSPNLVVGGERRRIGHRQRMQIEDEMGKG